MPRQPNILPSAIDAPEQDYLYVAASGISGAGKGLFTAIEIFPGEVIALYRGEILKDEEAAVRRKAGLDAYFINLLDGSVMDCANSTECFAKFANDAIGPAVKDQQCGLKANAEISLDEEERVCLVAMAKIEAGAEVLTKYGKAYWERSKQ